MLISRWCRSRLCCWASKANLLVRRSSDRRSVFCGAQIGAELGFQCKTQPTRLMQDRLFKHRVENTLFFKPLGDVVMRMRHDEMSEIIPSRKPIPLRGFAPVAAM